MSDAPLSAPALLARLYGVVDGGDGDLLAASWSRLEQLWRGLADDGLTEPVTPLRLPVELPARGRGVTSGPVAARQRAGRGPSRRCSACTTTSGA